MGVGTLAGSTIMLLTITWGGSLLVGRCDLNERVCLLPRFFWRLTAYQMAHRVRQSKTSKAANLENNVVAADLHVELCWPA